MAKYWNHGHKAVGLANHKDRPSTHLFMTDSLWDGRPAENALLHWSSRCKSKREARPIPSCSRFISAMSPLVGLKRNLFA